MNGLNGNTLRSSKYNVNLYLMKEICGGKNESISKWEFIIVSYPDLFLDLKK